MNHRLLFLHSNKKKSEVCFYVSFEEKVRFVFIFKNPTIVRFSSNYKKSWTQNSKSEVGIPSDLAS